MKVAERAGFKTWKSMYDQFCEDIVKGSRLEEFVTIWSRAWDFKAIRSAALNGEDALFFCMYDMIRARMFAESSLDPEQPRRDIQKKWRDYTLPQGQLTWTICDQLIRSLNTIRGQRMEIGTLVL